MDLICCAKCGDWGILYTHKRVNLCYCLRCKGKTRVKHMEFANNDEYLAYKVSIKLKHS